MFLQLKLRIVMRQLTSNYKLAPPLKNKQKTSKQTLLKNRNNLRRDDLEIFAQVKILS